MLVSTGHIATACPFRDAYHFVYSNNSGGFCRNPVSYVKPCAGPSRMLFHFKHCSDAAYTYTRGEQMKCAFYLINRRNLINV